MAPLHLDDTQKEWLLKIARETLVEHLAGHTSPDYAATDPVLLQEVAVFVTLWQKDGALRGCVGRLEKLEALYKMVQYCSIAAATRDIRFTSVGEEDLPNLLMEISVLSTPEKISRPEEIEIGKHGLLIRQEEPYLRTGLLLPKVASERNWGRMQFLEAICQKASLPNDAWRTAELYVFETAVFAERKDEGQSN